MKSNDKAIVFIVIVGLFVSLLIGGIIGSAITQTSKNIELNFTNTMLDNCNNEKMRNYWNADSCRSELEQCKVNLAYSNGELWALKEKKGD